MIKYTQSLNKIDLRFRGNNFPTALFHHFKLAKTQIINHTQGTGIGIIHFIKQSFGFDENNNPKYAGLRGTINSDYKGDASGSDKKYSFRHINPNADTVHIFEGAIDLLSYATLLQMQGKEYKEYSLLTLAGVYNAKQYLNIKEVPVALSHFLKSNPQIKTMYLHLDNDIAGRNATKSLIHLLSDSYKVEARPPPKGKDVNDYLCYALRLPITKSKSERREAR